MEAKHYFIIRRTVCLSLLHQSDAMMHCACHKCSHFTPSGPFSLATGDLRTRQSSCTPPTGRLTFPSRSAPNIRVDLPKSPFPHLFWLSTCLSHVSGIASIAPASSSRLPFNNINTSISYQFVGHRQLIFSLQHRKLRPCRPTSVGYTWHSLLVSILHVSTSYELLTCE